MQCIKCSAHLQRICSVGQMWCTDYLVTLVRGICQFEIIILAVNCFAQHQHLSEMKQSCCHLFRASLYVQRCIRLKLDMYLLIFTISVQHKTSVIWLYRGSLPNKNGFTYLKKEKVKSCRMCPFQGIRIFPEVAVMVGLVFIVKALLVQPCISH